MDDLISRQAAIDAVDDIHQEHLYKQIGDRDTYSLYNEGWSDACNRIDEVLNTLPSTQPDNRLERIADIVEGTIDHLDRDDAMDMLYQIKEVLK